MRFDIERAWRATEALRFMNTQVTVKSRWGTCGQSCLKVYIYEGITYDRT